MVHHLDFEYGFKPQHVAAIFGLLLLIFGLGVGATLFYGYVRPESGPGRFKIYLFAIMF